MNTSSAPPIKRRTAIIGWITIFTQAALPLSFAYAPLVHAATPQDTSAPKWYQSGNNASQDKTMFGQSTDTLNGAGAALSQADSSGAAAGMARSAATGAVNTSVEEWLSQFGTARVQLNLDDNFKAEGSQADLLLPLYENKSVILFTQLGFRHIDSRNTGNLGVGARYFTGDWMLGTNTFFDNDFTGENRRIGLGLEAWRDYLKLSANSYIRLSEWHQSRDFADYDERPANGYDLRAEGWLPAFPQLGAKVMYEKYQGDEVALFGKDNRQKDPWAFTGGVTYTPVPLVTVGAQHRAGKDGQNDSQLLLEMNYRLGEPWDKQIDPNLVGASRTLSGTRYDLVERNNSIVLDYRKQETVTLVVPEKTSGKSGSTIPVSFTVKSQHPLQRIDWDAASLVAAGGSLTQISNSQLSVVLPAYQAGNNVYRFAGVAYDVNGNSGSATGQISVEVGDVSATMTKVSADPTSIIADGKSISTVSISLFDASGNAIPGMAKSLTATIKETLSANQPASLSGPQAAAVGAISETSPGIYQAVVTSGTGVGSIVVSPKFDDTALTEVTVTETADNATGQIGNGAFTAVVDNSLANNTAMNQVKATVTDAGGNPLANTAVTFALSGSATVAAGYSLSATTDDKGQVTINFVDKVAEAVTVTATLQNGNTGTVETHFLADSSTATLSDGAVTVDKTTVIANNTDVATYSAVVKDANGNVVPNFTVNWTTDKGTLSGASSSTDANGVATVTLKHNVAEAVQVTAKAGSSANVNAPVVNFTADSGNLSPANSALAATPTTIVANGVEASAITLSLKDVNNNAVSGQAVTFTSSLGGSNVGSVQDNGDGTYTAQLTGVTAGTAAITANIGGSTFAVAAVNVTLTADSGNLSAANSTITAAPATIVANGTNASTVTLSLKDVNNNAVSGQAVTFSSSLGGSSVGTVKDNGDGTYSAPLTGTTAGTATITTTVNGTAFGVTSATVTLTADSGNLSSTHSAMAASPTSIVADGTTASTITLTLKDANNNAVSGQTVTFTSSLTNSSIGIVTDNGDGTYSAPLTGTTTGTATITTQVGGNNFGVTGATVTLTAGAVDASKSTLAVNKASINADDTVGSTITFTAKDAHGNLVSGLTATFTTGLANSQITNVVDQNNGTYTANLSGTKAGTADIALQVGGSPVADLTASVTITSGAWNSSQAAALMTLAVPTEACKLSGAVYQRNFLTVNALSLFDNHGNTIPGKLVYKGEDSNGTTVTGASWSVGTIPSSNIDAGTSKNWTISESYASEAACKAAKVATTNSTITVTGIIDDFGTKPVTKTFTLGSG